ncbi:MAG: DUF1810 domain-containing protein [Zoogloeaceae bacterium]|nr:DUF1810 domain-containing protein [Zoogloeaceae bacterium]
MADGRYDLDRFVAAQAESYAAALAELRRGRKTSHWIWFVFPQLRGLGRSDMALFYGLEDLGEAKAYVAHPILGPRLVESVRAMLAHSGVSASQILGEGDALKFRSCLTLFLQVAPADELFMEALKHFYGGQPDQMTLSMLADQGSR